MKLKRPEISPTPWVHHVDTVWHGAVPSCFPIVCHPINNRRSIADAQAISQLPEVMDWMEATYFYTRNCAPDTVGIIIHNQLANLMLAMGYTEVPEEGEK